MDFVFVIIGEHMYTFQWNCGYWARVKLLTKVEAVEILIRIGPLYGSTFVKSFRFNSPFNWERKYWCAANRKSL